MRLAAATVGKEKSFTNDFSTNPDFAALQQPPRSPSARGPGIRLFSDRQHTRDKAGSAVIPFPELAGAIMADDPNPTTAHDLGKEVTIKDGPLAPVIYFDGVPTFGYNNGIVNLLLAVGLILPTKDGVVLAQSVAVAHLRCNAFAAAQLRDSIDKALLLAAPTPEGKAN
jgi:hypothetical protein